MKTIYITAGPGTMLIGKAGEVGTEEKPILLVGPPIGDVQAHPLNFNIFLLTPIRYEAIKRIIGEQEAEYITKAFKGE